MTSSTDQNEDSTVVTPGTAVTVVTRVSGSNVSEPISFVAGAQQVASWLEDAVTGLRCGNKVDIAEQPDKNIPSVSVTVQHITPPIDSLPLQPTKSQVQDQAEKLRLEGNTIFKDTASNDCKGFKSAVLLYHKALHYNEIGENSNDFQVRVRLNLALCFLRMYEWTACIAQCDAVLALDKNSAKAYFRHAQASIELGFYVRAISDLEAAHKLCPNDLLIHKELIRVRSEAKKTTLKRRQEFAEIYNVMPESPIFSDALHM